MDNITEVSERLNAIIMYGIELMFKKKGKPLPPLFKNEKKIGKVYPKKMIKELYEKNKKIKEFKLHIKRSYLEYITDEFKPIEFNDDDIDYLDKYIDIRLEKKYLVSIFIMK